MLDASADGRTIETYSSYNFFYCFQLFICYRLLLLLLLLFIIIIIIIVVVVVVYNH